MIAFAYVVLFLAPIIAVAVIVSARGTARSVAGVMVFGWLFMPLLGVKIAEGIPLFSKNTALMFGGLVGMLLVRPEAFLRIRPKWVDLPMVVWCLVPIASSLDNGLGFYDGVSAAFAQWITWGAPYLIGRLVFVDAEAMVEFARVLAMGGVAYFPLVLIESRMAPQIHRWVYGMGGRSNWETADFFGPLRYKSSVFLQANLELTPLMAAAALCGWWLWRAGRSRPASRDRVSGWVAAAAAMATVLGKSLGGFTVGLAGAGALFLGQRYRRSLFLAALLAVAPTYMATRAAGVWSGAQVVQFLKEYVSVRRAESMETRLVNEDQLTDKAMERPVFGWAGWGRARVYDENGKDISLTDGMWVIAAGNNGLVGLAALYGALLLPVALVVRRAGPSLWSDPRLAGVAPLAVVVTLHSIDCLANAMPNPIYYAAAGGLAAVSRLPLAASGNGVVFRRRAKRVRAVVQAPPVNPAHQFEVGRSAV